MLFAGQYKDDETTAWRDDGATVHRPGVVLNGFRTYDPWAGVYLEVDPLVDATWSPYVYVNSNPVGKRDRDGLKLVSQHDWQGRWSTRLYGQRPGTGGGGVGSNKVCHEGFEYVVGFIGGAMVAAAGFYYGLDSLGADLSQDILQAVAAAGMATFGGATIGGAKPPETECEEEDPEESDNPGEPEDEDIE